MFGIEDETYDGYHVFVTTEFDLSEREVVGSYKIRDQIEKAFADSEKCTQGSHPQNVRTEEHVLGNIFVCESGVSVAFGTGYET